MGIALTTNDLYIVDYNNSQLRKMSKTDPYTVSTIFSTTAAQSTASTSDGTIYAVDRANKRVKKVVATD